MKVESIMTSDVISVAPGASIEQAARLMVDHGISGLPVVDDTGALVGILTEGDLIVRQKPRTALSWWEIFFTDAERLAREYQKAMGTTVAEVMTRSVVCVRPDTPLEAAAALIHEHNIRRVPVVSGGALVGIVSRADLIKALARGEPERTVARSDAQLVREMQTRMKAEAWLSNRNILIEASDGILSLWGVVETESEKSALETMARAIPGSRGVDSHLLIQQALLTSYSA
ncbi:MAG: CBS domain-containing protein [Candidatus Rokubacteria bacterium]|nr:CBS domain-containing protein [Candidatus Rokubacteria bacterium]